MKFTDYAIACYPDEVNILGLQLKPFCLGHYILMRRFGCNYAAEGESQLDFGDFLLGLVICSMTYEENIQFFNQKYIPFFSWENFKSYGLGWYISKTMGRAFWEVYCWGRKVKRMSKRDKTFNVYSKIQQFNKYITDGQRMPMYFELNKNNARSNSHWSTSLKITMMGELGYTESQVLNTPLVQLFAEYCRYAESQGAIELMSDYEEELAKIAMKN